MARRHTQKPKLDLDIWTEKEGLYFADVIELSNKVPREIPEIARRMGEGYHLLHDALSGKGLDIWAALHVEHGISTKPKPEMKNWKPWEKR